MIIMYLLELNIWKWKRFRGSVLVSDSILITWEIGGRESVVCLLLVKKSKLKNNSDCQCADFTSHLEQVPFSMNPLKYAALGKRVKYKTQTKSMDTCSFFYFTMPHLRKMSTSVIYFSIT